MTTTPIVDRPVRNGDMIDCPICHYRITANAEWIASVSQTLRLSKRHSERFALINAPGCISEFPVQVLEIFRCGKCNHRGAIRVEDAPINVGLEPEARLPRVKGAFLDPYSITPAEAKDAIARELRGISRNQIIMLHNQRDDLELNADELAIVEGAYSKLNLSTETGYYDGMAVTSKPNRAN